jgi:surface antigen
MKIASRILLLFIATTILSSCDSMNKQGKGTLIGGAAGALLGSRFGKGGGALAATGAGALIGAFIGNQIGASLDDQDREIASLKTQQALENSTSGTTIEWRNPDSGNHGYITPTNTFKQNDGNYCREYTQVIVVGGKEEKAFGKACRQPDGAWKIVE